MTQVIAGAVSITFWLRSNYPNHMWYIHNEDIHVVLLYMQPLFKKVNNMWKRTILNYMLWSEEYICNTLQKYHE